MNDEKHLIVFFDLGDTLVRRISVSPAGAVFGWVPGAQRTLTDLRQNSVLLGLISNTGNLRRQDLLQMLPQDFSFETFEDSLVLLSSETGNQKPDLEIFRLALQRAKEACNCDSDSLRCVYCSENLTETLAAQRAGMCAARVRLPPNSDIDDLAPALRATGVFDQV
jgi:FMN phosphatase YigB (HAD superfamily)